jgi:hypothetical protein
VFDLSDKWIFQSRQRYIEPIAGIDQSKIKQAQINLVREARDCMLVLGEPKGINN